MTLFDFYKKFDTEQKCVDYLIHKRWPDGIKCPFCGHDRYYKTDAKSYRGERKVKMDLSNNQYKCANNKCYKKFNAKTGTIFQDSKIPLWQFFYFIFMTSINNKSFSSYQQGISLGIAQKNCWLVMAKVRMLCFQDEGLIFDGDVEVDESYVSSGKWVRRQKITGRGSKVPVLGILKRGGNVIVKVLTNKRKKTIQDIILKHVACGSHLFTDSAPCYHNMSSYYIHKFVNHRNGEYVRGDVHTNGIESFWSKVKKSVIGVHNSVSVLHLQSYCDEIAYKWNNRDKSPLDRFHDLLTRGCNIKPAGLNNIKKYGNNRSYYRIGKTEIIDTNTGEIFKSQVEASKALGVSANSLSKMLTGKIKNTTTLMYVASD